MTPLAKRITRVTRGALDGSHGVDRGRNIVVALDVGDVIEFRPKGCRRAVKLSVFDAYLFAIRCRANALHARFRALKKTMPARAAMRAARKEFDL